MSTKGCSGLFSFYLKLELCICQNKQRPDFYTLTETRFTNNSNLNKVKKNPKHPFVDIGKTEKCAKFQQKC